MKEFILATISLLVFVIAIYGCYWIAKNVSYSLFYEDMVRQTIIETVNKASLK